MTKARAALLGFIGAISLSLLLFTFAVRGPVISKIASPDNTYVVHLRGKKSNPSVPLIQHTVYFDLLNHGKEVVAGRQLHSGDWFDPGFDDLFPQHTWVNSSTLMFYRGKAAGGTRDTVNVTNHSAKSIRFLHVQSVDLFLVFDIKAQARTTLSASSQTWFSWLAVEGEFEDGKRIPRKGVNFIIRGENGPFTYEIAIHDDGPTISSSELPVYHPE